jgi:hypothetical protein
LPHYLDISAFTKVIANLDEGFERYQSSPGDLQLQDGLMLRLKTAYELSYEMIKRYLKMDSPGTAQNQLMTFHNVIGHAKQQGLILGCTKDWLVYREMYFNAKHAYEPVAAHQALLVVPKFLIEAFALLQSLVLWPKD